jgi:cation diffusion facilitator CzcD-associated flavoprotein CzcO
MAPSRPHHDVLIIGAGLSGIGMACHLTRECPNKRIAVLERRQAMGGTWDLFRYPGIRSDSDMFSFGFGFRPWNDFKTLADGPSIKRYVEETAREYGVDQKIHFGLKVLRSDWSSTERRWTVTALHEPSGETREYTASFVVMCTGYYNYDDGHLPDFPGADQYQGIRVHPQKWPEGLDYKGKRVLVIGSGATAVTLVPAMAEDAAHVTMLQRSPTYIFSLPAIDKLSKRLVRYLPEKWVFGMARKRNIWLTRLLYKGSIKWPNAARRLIQSGVEKQLGPDFDMRHFTPRYNPWVQRMCVVPNGDLFRVLREGKASVVTDSIDTFTRKGVRLASGEELQADIIVTATGLELQALGGMEVAVDHQPQALNQKKLYKSTLIEDLPNFGWVVGYTNAPWTLKADIASLYICRLLQYMKTKNLDVALPVDAEGCTVDGSIFGSLESGYVNRAKDRLLRQGGKGPWVVTHNYERDQVTLLRERIDDGVLRFTPAAPQKTREQTPMQAAA